MWYLGGKHRQSKAIVGAICSDEKPDRYHEPFCGSLSSAMSVSKALVGVPVVLSDANPYLVCFWKEAKDNGFNPPSTITEGDYAEYNSKRDVNDPMTAYVGFACSFGGKFFGGAARTDGLIISSYSGTMKKIQWLRETDVEISCRPYWDHPIPGENDLVYLDPPYVGRTPQSRVVPDFDRSHFCEWAESLPGTVYSSEFINDRGWAVVYNWGDTVVRHLSAKPADGTSEVLMRVSKFSGKR